MTQQIFLTPDQIAQMEPSEGNDRRHVWLSPFALPRKVSARRDPASNSLRITFDYSAEESATPSQKLDELTDPAVSVQTATHTHKVLEIQTEPFVGPSGLGAIAARFRAAAEGIQGNPARRLSYLMVAEILAYFATKLGDEAGRWE